jgi:hypothetical protein
VPVSAHVWSDPQPGPQNEYMPQFGMQLLRHCPVVKSQTRPDPQSDVWLQVAPVLGTQPPGKLPDPPPDAPPPEVELEKPEPLLPLGLSATMHRWSDAQPLSAMQETRQMCRTHVASIWHALGLLPSHGDPTDPSAGLPELMPRTPAHPGSIASAASVRRPVASAVREAELTTPPARGARRAPLRSPPSCRSAP